MDHDKSKKRLRTSNKKKLSKKQKNKKRQKNKTKNKKKRSRKQYNDDTDDDVEMIQEPINPLKKRKITNNHNHNNHAKRETYGQKISKSKKNRKFGVKEACNPSNEVFENLKELELENTQNFTFEQYTTKNCKKLAGKWKMHYTGKSCNQITELVINKNGKFAQNPSNYKGNWWIKGGLLVLEYSSLHLSGETTPIRLQCELNAESSVFNGVKCHPDYICYDPSCALVYVGEKKL